MRKAKVRQTTRAFMVLVCIAEVEGGGLVSDGDGDSDGMGKM